MENHNLYKLGIDIGSTTVKVAILDSMDHLLFSDYQRHFANIQETLSELIGKAISQIGDKEVAPMITGSGGLTLAKHLDVPFTQEVQYLPPCSTMPQRLMWQLSLVERMLKLYILKTETLNSV